MLTYKDEIHEYVISHKTEIIDNLKELVKIPSVKSEATAGYPFGKECGRALEYTKALYEKNGFDTELFSESGYLLSCFGKGEHSLGIFAHSDVVPVSDDWTLTSPFEPVLRDGFLVGRGAYDDKAAVVTSLYAARIIKELGIPFNSRLVMFTGSNEESGMADIKSYVKEHTPPEFSLVADACFPLYRGDKGKMLVKAERKAPLGEFLSFVGGNSGTNVAEATAKLLYTKELYEYLKDKENENLSVSVAGGKIIISAKGIAKHTALPEGSLNAAAIIAEILSYCPYLSEQTRIISNFIFDVTSDFYGVNLGISNDDKDFGRLTFVNYIIEADNNGAELYFNSRYGASVDTEIMKEKLSSSFGEYGFEVQILDDSRAFIIPEDNPLLLSLMNVFEEYTGIKDKMYVNAGGTYARYLPLAAEIGVSTLGGVPTGIPVGHGGVHQADECISIDGLLSGIELTALMLLECDKNINRNE